MSTQARPKGGLAMACAITALALGAVLSPVASAAASTHPEPTARTRDGRSPHGRSPHGRDHLKARNRSGRRGHSRHGARPVPETPGAGPRDQGREEGGEPASERRIEAEERALQAAEEAAERAEEAAEEAAG